MPKPSVSFACPKARLRDRFLVLSRRRIIDALVFAAAFILTEVGRGIYRPVVYGRGIRDLGLADTMGNHLGTVVLISFTLAV